MKNKLLTQIQNNIELKVSDKDKNDFNKIVTAGLKVMFAKDMTKKLIQGLDKAPDKLKAVADGITGLLGMLFNQSRKTMPIPVMIPSGISLLMEALDFLEEANHIPALSKEDIAKATHDYYDSMLPRLGITPEKIQSMIKA